MAAAFEGRFYSFYKKWTYIIWLTTFFTGIYSKKWKSYKDLHDIHSCYIYKVTQNLKQPKIADSVSDQMSKL